MPSSFPSRYGSFGGKAGLVLALVDLIDSDSDLPALIGRLFESDPREVLELAVRIPRSVVESSGDLIVALAGAAPTTTPPPRPSPRAATATTRA